MEGDERGGDIGSCFTSPRKFSSISQASFFVFSSVFCSQSSFVSASFELFDVPLSLFGRGYPELVVQALDDELEGDSRSEAIVAIVEWLSCLPFEDAANAAAATAAAAFWAASLLDKFRSVATADVDSISAALFIAYP